MAGSCIPFALALTPLFPTAVLPTARAREFALVGGHPRAGAAGVAPGFGKRPKFGADGSMVVLSPVRELSE